MMRNDDDDDKPHLAGRVVVPVAAHPARSKPLDFDYRVKVPVYDNKRKARESPSRRP